MKAQKIETIKKRFHREWLLIAVDKMDKATTTPISGRLITHSPHRDEVYRKLLALKRRREILVEYSEDKLPHGYAAAFQNVNYHKGKFELDTRQGIIFCKARIAALQQSILLKLAVDTGASITMIPSGAALGIGIDPSKTTRHIEITTASGIILTPIIRIPSFMCFGVEVKNLDVICHNLPPESAVEGLLGLNFLKVAKVIIDFSQGTIITR